jgi:hypothetical protein
MLRIRTVSAAALTAATLILAVSGASAQTASSEQPSKPMPLLAGLTPPHTAKTHKTKAHDANAHETKAISHAKVAHKKTAVRTVRKPAHAPVVAAAQAMDTAAPPVDAQDALPAPAQAEQAQPAQLNNAAASSTSDAIPAPDDSGPNSVVMNGQSVEIASPDYLNDIDRTAGDGLPAASAPAQSDSADAAPASRSVFAAPAHKEGSRVGSASWIAQMLAAIGGAAAAGTVAWFLIGTGPVRIYG